ncbi:ATPase, T2SS/T4P/T4SS family [Burkholderia cepacia]|uniref:ATPase, T2SS/T4P/T4SS family n=1 Tax=Burkholderia cepacia TaxID=292 RepID=UPI001CF2A2E5|nr:ATPase, T2SS/T4P/T4SS family [Burkholderia cepacia]MCA8355597.1 Flp pilus assembly complex ATPase component TadA [Burkholderia cepacia]
MDQPRPPAAAGLELDDYQRALAEIERAREKQGGLVSSPRPQELTQPIPKAVDVEPIETSKATAVDLSAPAPVAEDVPLETEPAKAEPAFTAARADPVQKPEHLTKVPPAVPRMRASAPQAPARPANARPPFIAPVAKPAKERSEPAPRAPLLSSAALPEETPLATSVRSGTDARGSEVDPPDQEITMGVVQPFADVAAQPIQDRGDDDLAYVPPAPSNGDREPLPAAAVSAQPSTVAPGAGMVLTGFGTPTAPGAETRPTEYSPKLIPERVVDDEPDPPLSQLDFSDLYIESGGRVWYKRAPTDMFSADVEGQALADALLLREACTQQAAAADFYLTFQDVPLRIDHVRTRTGTVFVCRRLNSKPRPIDELGYPKRLIDAVLSSEIQAGMILLAGSAGAGKTTTLASIGASRLARFGGTAFTIENPFELGLEGTYHGADGVVGTCYQTQVSSDAEFGNAIKQRLRSGPNMLFIGEIRSADAAAEAAIAGASGHIVGATIHGSNPIATLERYRALLTSAGQDVSLLGESLAVLIHQSMRIVREGDLLTRRVDPYPLVITGHKNEGAIRANLRKGDFAMLSSEVDRQRRVLVENGAG